jgi:hypothetical protein
MIEAAHPTQSVERRNPGVDFVVPLALFDTSAAAPGTRCRALQPLGTRHVAGRSAISPNGDLVEAGSRLVIGLDAVFDVESFSAVVQVVLDDAVDTFRCSELPVISEKVSVRVVVVLKNLGLPPPPDFALTTAPLFLTV